MTTVNVVLTPGVDTDQSDSAQAQLTAAPDGTLGNETIINMPPGRYRINKGLKLAHRNHIRWRTPSVAATWPTPHADTAVFTAYTDLNGDEQGLPGRNHFMINDCTNVVGSFMRVDGPNLDRDATFPLYANYNAQLANEHAFSIQAGSIDCGWQDCSYTNVYGDGGYVGFQNAGVPNEDCWFYRLTGTYSGRMGFSLTHVEGFTGIDVKCDFVGFAGFDIEPNNADEHVWDVYCENFQMGSHFFPYTFQGGGASNVPPAKKNIHLKDCTVIRCPATHTWFLSRNAYSQGEGGLILENFHDGNPPSNSSYGVDITGWDDVTIINPRLTKGAGNNTTTSYGFRIGASGTVTVTGGTFNGISQGYDQLYTLASTPTRFIHYGNVWNMGASNDGQPPVALFATPGQVTITGGTASVSVVASVLPGPTFVGTFVGGAPFRLRSSRGLGRLRGAAGSRLRGTQGPAERHPWRLRAADGYGRLRSVQTPSFIRSMEPVSNPATVLALTSGNIVVQGGTAALSGQLTGATSGQIALSGGTHTLSVVGTVTALPVTAGQMAIAGGTHLLPMRLAATSGNLVLAGSATLDKGLPETSGQVAIAGGTALISATLAATSGNVVLQGGSAGLNGQVNFTATSGTLSLVGGTALLSIRTASTSGHVSIVGGTAAVSLTKIIRATPGELAILGGQAGLHTLHAVGTGNIVIEGGSAELLFQVIVPFTATPGTITITGGTAHLTSGGPYPEWPMGELAPEWEMAGV